VRDTGHGIETKDLPRLFDPFFTTKPIGQGTGLGLSICRQIVDDHGGRIEVESKPGEGSVFRVILPAATEAMPSAPPPTDPAPAVRRGRILVVDDEPKILQLMERTVGAEHHVVTETAAREALRRLKAREEFDVIFCDLMMPDMTGMDLFEETRQFAPELAARFVFITGGAFTPYARGFLDRVPNLCIEKPFDPKKIRALVRDLLLQVDESECAGKG
jgi:CheY-like chemotaxis protein